ncbi:probable helicase senataxin isoform X2 [Meriones unguiculatus]|uniref:probable helicase senataxin isoform X2 n=1 Tax=Meriones unguiculatus TaxID=10047 RepID=UPI000B4EBC28|nr:probable helicase senataxin isoform X2 [Meriones unguiculatus]
MNHSCKAVLWELETLRLIHHFEKCMKAEVEDDDELYIVDNNGEEQLFDCSGQDFENKLRVPLFEILKYPYLLLHERVNELCVEALCRMEQTNSSFQVFDKYPGIYLFLVHPNEMVRRWAILTARNLGKVDRDDYYDLQEVLTCLFKVIELGLLESPDIYTSSVLEKGKLILLPAHMYDTTNYKNYWLGICMLLTILEEQAMDSLLLGSDKQNDFMQSILHTMEKQSDDDSMDPFWPALHCFMVILDRLGSKVWGQLIDPIEAFQTIINNVSYNKEIQNIRNSSIRTKLEPEPHFDDMVTCSQIVYNYNPEKTKKDSGWRSAICPDYCPNMYEEMETLASVLQSDIGQDMRVHNSTFLWFIPFVQSLMDLKDLGVAYIVEVIHHLYSEVRDVLNQTDAVCDKVTEFFILILISVIELHRNKKCLHLLWVSSQQWVEAVVKCAKLPTTAFARSCEKSPGSTPKGAAIMSSLGLHSVQSNSVQLACVQLIRGLLKEGYQLGQQTLCKRFWDKLNLFLRGNLSLGWQLTAQETLELQTCLKQIIRNIKIKMPQYSAFGDLTFTCKSPPSFKEESEQIDTKSKKDIYCLENCSPTSSKEPIKADSNQVLSKADITEVENLAKQHYIDLNEEEHLSTELCLKRKNEALFSESAQQQVKISPEESGKENSSYKPQNSISRNGPELGSDRGVIISTHSLTDSSTDSLEKVSTSSEDVLLKDGTVGKTSKPKSKAQKDEICAKLSHVIKKQHRKSTLVNNNINLEENTAISDLENFCSGKDRSTLKEDDAITRGVSLDSALDDEHGQQKSQDSLLLKKKQIKSEELDNTSSDENKCQRQKGHAAVPCEGPIQVVVESRDVVELRYEEMRKSTALTSDLVKGQVPPPGSSKPSVTGSQVDLCNVSVIAQTTVIQFPSGSSKQSSSELPKKDDKRCLTANGNTADSCRGQIIVISDSDEDDERSGGTEKNIKQSSKVGMEKDCPEQQGSVVNTSVEKLVKEEGPQYPEEIEDSESQVFEFESLSEVFSVWQDHKIDSKNTLQEEGKGCVTHVADSTNSTLGCGADSVCEEVRHQAEDIKEHTEPHSSVSAEEFCKTGVKKSKRKRCDRVTAEDPQRPSSSVRAEQLPDDRDITGSDFKNTDTGTSAPSSSVERDSTTQKKSTKPHTHSKPVRKVPASKATKKTLPDTKRGQNNKSSCYISCRTSPAIVPPKKFRQCPEPTSTVEKLGLKKAPRKAFELSQRSLECIVQLRDHGKTVGVVNAPKKTKLISPHTLSIKNNKLLTSQDLQFQRLVRSRSHQKRDLDYKNTDISRAVPCTVQVSDGLEPDDDGPDNPGGSEPLSNSNEKKLAKFMLVKPEEARAIFDHQVTDITSLVNQCESRVLSGGVPTDVMMVSASEDPVGGDASTVQVEEEAAVEAGEPESSSDTDDDNLFLTQHDPQDMDLCSQLEDDKPIIVAHKKDRVQREDSVSRPQLESLSVTKCKYKDCVETTKTQGKYCPIHCDAKAADDDVFRKPGLPLSVARPSRPTTTKIFSSSSASRTANLSKTLESTTFQSALKKSGGPQPNLKVTPPLSVVSQKPVAAVKSLCNIFHFQTPSSSNKQNYKPTLNDNKPMSASSPLNILLPSQSIFDTFIKEVLKWKYQMFLNFDKCGAPPSLCQSISRPVPVRFQDCVEYFNVFLPLIILNAFETAAQEWLNSPNKENFYQLHLRKFPADYKKYWEFMIYLEESELAKQLHPKENDLVFLVPEKLHGDKKDMDRNGLQDCYYCGYVHKFRRTSVVRSGKAECSLCIQTQDILPASLKELTKCIVISSLVTTQRKLKAMSLLSSRNQLARAVLNPNPMDFCTKDLLTTTSERIITYLKDFNEDQKKAIETAYAMVKHSPSVAKICLIHGPPGTGKSKTIVGLLYRLLTESQRKGRSDENFNAKIKQNRVLVCAPSNAAVDELMKKIILEFKEKCKDKKNPLGNCGDINLVRLGPEKSINAEVLKFSLDSQVNHRMQKELPSHTQELLRRKEFLDGQLDELSRQRALCRGGREMQRRELDGHIAKVSKERQELALKIKEVQGRPQRTQNTIILESHVICCTLSTSGGLLLESAFRGQGGVPFSCVIVDEAGQSCEVETLSPLIHRCSKLILVGDPKQLPPTVISMKAQEYGYDQSMMARFCKLLEENVEQSMISRLPILQLTIQYRMHPDICLFPSNYVYNKNLKTNRLTESIRCSSDWPFQPYLVFDVGDGSEQRDNDSYINVQEIKLVMEIIKLIKEKRKDISFRNIGIITHYKAQKMMIQKDLEKEFDTKGLLQPIMMGESKQQDPEASHQKKKSSECMHVNDEQDFCALTQSGISCPENGVTHTGPAEVDTVDAFQGRQKDCIIVTCVRASSVQGSIGFLASLQRLNVTITRAKYSLFILGHLRTLMENEHWYELIQDAQKRGAIIKTCGPNYKRDAMKILKLKPVLQRSVTHPPATAPEAPRPQGGLPSGRLDSGLTTTSFAASLYHTPSDAITSKESERPPFQERLRDPRLFRRLDAEAKGTFLKDAQPVSSQLPGLVHLLGQSGFPVIFQDLSFVVPPSTAIVAPLGSHRSPMQAQSPPAHLAAASTSKRNFSHPDAELRHRRAPRAFSEEERHGSVTQHMLRNANWDRRDPEQGDSSAKKRRFL